MWSLGLLPLLTGWPPCLLASVLGVPCPTCGMTRALRLVVAGHLRASLGMHPLALPTALAAAVFAAATIWAAAAYGSVVEVRRMTVGRGAFFALAFLYAAAVLLWAARWLGWAGGPVSVD